MYEMMGKKDKEKMKMKMKYPKTVFYDQYQRPRSMICEKKRVEENVQSQ